MTRYLIGLVMWSRSVGEVPKATLIMHRNTCAVGAHLPQGLVLKRFRWAKDASRWVTDAVGPEDVGWRRCPICVPTERQGLSSAPLRRALQDALAMEPRSHERLIEDVAAFGGAAIEAVEPWLFTRKLARFAVDVIEATFALDPAFARETLERAQWTTASAIAARIRSALERLGEGADHWPDLPADARSVAFVGDGPHLAQDLASRVPIGELVRDAETVGFIDTIVLGSAADLSSRVRERMKQQPRPARFVPQEGWIELVLFGRDWWRDPQQLNDAADWHAPLGEVRERWPRADFAWPGTATSGDGPPVEAVFNPVGFLRESGYQITGMDHPERIDVLRRVTIPQYGLQHVAEGIANLARLKKLSVSADYSYAIGQWELDLEVLRREDYPRLGSRFPWPGTGPDSPGPRTSSTGATTNVCVCGAVFKSARHESEIDAHPLGLCGVKGRSTHRGGG